MSAFAERFRDALRRSGLGPGCRPLLALSGGLDSSVLFHLLKAEAVDFAAAHVNYGLRGADSDADEQFCRTLAEENGISIHVYCARADMERSKVSVQEAAREIRYRFFADLCERYGYTHILTAHHANDSAETFFINLLRGSGARGLTGIPAQNGRIVRPLLLFWGEELENLAAENGWTGRIDISNASPDYLRNRIRHELIPTLENIENKALDRLAVSIENLNSEVRLLDFLLASRFPASPERTPKKDVSAFPRELWPVVLFWRFRPLGLSFDRAEDLAAALESPPGKIFHTPTHRILSDREDILAEERPSAPSEEILLTDEHGALPGYRVSVLGARESTFPKDAASAFLDLDTLTFPLVWRHIRMGDVMEPLGLKGRKKISDILVDAKVDRFAKENLHVLCSGERIVWLEGLRIADSSKITPQTTRVLCLIPEKL